MAIKTNENFIPFSNSVVTASELIPGFCRSKSNVPTPESLRTIKAWQGDGLRHQIPTPCPHSPPPPHGIYIDRCIRLSFAVKWPNLDHKVCKEKRARLIAYNAYTKPKGDPVGPF